MTRGKNNNAEYMQRGEHLVSLRDLATYLHARGQSPPIELEQLRALRSQVEDSLIGAAGRVHAARTARQFIETAPRAAYPRVSKRGGKELSPAASMPLRLRQIYLNAHEVDAYPFRWVHMRHVRAHAAPKATYFLFWTDQVFVPAAFVALTEAKSSRPLSVCGEVGRFLTEQVPWDDPDAGGSLMPDQLGFAIGHLKKERRNRRIWPEAGSIGHGKTAPKSTPSISAASASLLSTFFVDEPLFQLWDPNVWVILAPQRAMILSRRSLSRYTPRWRD